MKCWAYSTRQASAVASVITKEWKASATASARAQGGAVAVRMRHAPTETRASPKSGTPIAHTDADDGILQPLGVAAKHRCRRFLSQSLAGRLATPSELVYCWDGSRAPLIHPLVPAYPLDDNPCDWRVRLTICNSDSGQLVRWSNKNGYRHLSGSKLRCSFRHHETLQCLTTSGSPSAHTDADDGICNENIRINRIFIRCWLLKQGRF